MKTNGHGSTSTPENAIKRVAGMAHEAVDKAADAAAPTAEWLTERGEDLSAKKKELTTDASNYVSAHPLKAVGIAVVLGVLLGRVFR